MTRKQALGGLAVAGVVVWRMAAAQRPPQPAIAAPPAPEPAAPAVAPRGGFRRRLATSAVFAVLFFAGAALAAGAGNEVVSVDDGSTDTAVLVDATTTDVTTTTTTEETTPTTTPAAEPVEADPTDATPAPHAFSPAPAPVAPVPVVPARPVVRRAPHRTVAAEPAPAVQSPFPVVAFDPQAWLAGHPGSPLGNAAVAIAQRFRGVPYRWGGNTPATGFDCSGLTQYVYAQLGVWLPHYAAAQFLAYPRLDPSELEPGDLVFFEPKADGPGHVAIYAGNGEIVEAPHTGALVRTGSLAGAAASLGFLGAVRPTPDAPELAPTPARAIAGRFIAV